ncbi:response regulator [Cryptosporangium japonicum]|uniref:Response regulator n=1 Tax=Cryptosporangium japonicum TaxID=80872 RepID=A0ABN0UJ60_9ACTN
MVNDVVLLVEDSDEDVEAVRRALRVTHPAVRVEHVSSGGELVPWLSASGRPALVLLDLNMPGLDGQAALQAARERAEFAEIPIVVFTSSTRSGDVDRAFEAGASGYLVKPLSFQLLQQSLARTVTYWLTKAEA